MFSLWSILRMFYVLDVWYGWIRHLVPSFFRPSKSFHSYIRGLPMVWPALTMGWPQFRGSSRDSFQFKSSYCSVQCIITWCASVISQQLCISTSMWLSLWGVQSLLFVYVIIWMFWGSHLHPLALSSLFIYDAGYFHSSARIPRQCSEFGYRVYSFCSSIYVLQLVLIFRSMSLFQVYKVLLGQPSRPAGQFSWQRFRYVVCVFSSLWSCPSSFYSSFKVKLKDRGWIH